MLDEKMQVVLHYVESLSLKDRELFYACSCATLITDMVNAQEEKGLENVRHDLAVLTDCAERMQYELEMNKEREAIAQKLHALHCSILSDGINDNVVNALAELTEAARNYVGSLITEDEEISADEDAYRNIKNLIQQETAKFEQSYNDAVVLNIPELPDFSDTLEPVSA